MPGTGLLPPPPDSPADHPWSVSFWGAFKLVMPWFALVLTLCSLAMLNWFVVTELRYQRESLRSVYIGVTRNQQDILLRLERIETRWARFERDRDGRDER